ncbi:hypothetical protein [Streptomyces sp. DW26H14]|uniref:hypothetical protein n=1 Tax=Streptomyces sp. DW26H14 TaxID=3435395 RepID=UPI00403D6049
MNTISQGTDKAQGDRPACPDNRAFCLGAPKNHADPREHIHRGPAHTLRDTDGGEYDGFAIVQWHDEAPVLEFQGSGNWDCLTLPAVDELVAAQAAHLADLRGTRDQLAELLGAEPKFPPTTADGARLEIASLITDRAHAYMADAGDDERSPGVRVGDIEDAAHAAAEDAAVALDHERQVADPHCEPRSETSNRYNARLRRAVTDLDALLSSAAAYATEQGKAPREEVGWAVALLVRLAASAMDDVLARTTREG